MSEGEERIDVLPAPPSQTILIVEDEPKLAHLLRDFLAQAGYAVHCVAHGLEVVPWVQQHVPTLILLDLMLPGKDGMEVCRELRAFSAVPIIMVTARVEEIDRLLGLEFGADDYICKPFSPREVVARVKAVLRRLQPQVHGAAAAVGFVLDEQRYCATLDGCALELTPVEFRLLSTFLAHPGWVFARSQLVEALYADFRVVSDRTVDSHIKNLRKKIRTIRPAPEVIRSVYGIGYKCEG
jgi:two-component system response regulator BaeR